MKIKRCTGCKEEKEVTCFRPNKSKRANKDKLQPQCKPCHSEARKRHHRKKGRLVPHSVLAARSEIYRLNRRMSKNIKRALKSLKFSKKWSVLVGYSATQLKEHLESLWKEGMSWENYGIFGWHIDHIIPKSSFKFNDENSEEFKKCWALSNLQPLWAAENLAKSDKMPDE